MGGRGSGPASSGRRAELRAIRGRAAIEALARPESSYSERIRYVMEQTGCSRPPARKALDAASTEVAKVFAREREVLALAAGISLMRSHGRAERAAVIAMEALERAAKPRSGGRKRRPEVGEIHQAIRALKAAEDTKVNIGRLLWHRMFGIKLEAPVPDEVINAASGVPEPSAEDIPILGYTPRPQLEAVPDED